MILPSALIYLAIAGVVSAAPTPSSSTNSSSSTNTTSSTSSTTSPTSSTSASSSTLISSTSSSSSQSSSATSAAPPEQSTVLPAPEALNYPIFQQDADVEPEAINGPLGATVIGPQNVELDRMNPDILAPPTSDHGNVMNAKWPFSLSNNRLQTGGWARQQNIDNFPIATEVASVDMRLEAGALRELHWHSSAEWAYVLKGSTRVTAINTDGQVFADTVNAGDLWYFPAGLPHSLQGTDDDPDGTEFLLVFDDGSFSESSTFQLTDWLAHVPKEVLAKNFKVNASAFDHIPDKELYIFPAAPPNSSPGYTLPESPQGNVPQPFTYHLSQMNETKLAGGSIKTFDTTNFKVADKIVGNLVTVEPGAMRELHWHPTQPEWDYFLEGQARMTLFASQANAQTFDYQAGDIGYVPVTYGHYIENTGNTTLRFLELFQSDVASDISLSQWLALTPPDIVKAHLDVDDDTIAHFSKTKPIVI